MRELVARVTVLHKHDLSAEVVLKAAMLETHKTNLLHERVLLASKLVEVNRCGDRSRAKEATRKLDSVTSCWVVRACLARLGRELDAEGVREDSSDPVPGHEMPLNHEVSEDKADGSQDGQADKLEKTEDETEITDDREQVSMMERNGENLEDTENKVVTKEDKSEVDKEEECHWEPGKVQWLELMEGETKLPSKMIGILQFTPMTFIVSHKQNFITICS